MNTSWKYVILFIIGIFIGLMLNIPFWNRPEQTITEVPVHDTVIIDSTRIQENVVYKYQTVHDTTVVYIQDTDTISIPIFIPIDHYEYNDTINTDSTSTQLHISYQGYKAKIDSVGVIHNYKQKETVIQEQQKRISPFITLQCGPKLDYNFQSVNGVSASIGAGLLFNKGYGVILDYELGAGQYIDHTIKIGFIKQW